MTAIDALNLELERIDNFLFKVVILGVQGTWMMQMRDKIQNQLIEIAREDAGLEFKPQPGIFAKGDANG